MFRKSLSKLEKCDLQAILFSSRSREEGADRDARRLRERREGGLSVFDRPEYHNEKFAKNFKIWKITAELRTKFKHVGPCRVRCNWSTPPSGTNGCHPTTGTSRRRTSTSSYTMICRLATRIIRARFGCRSNGNKTKARKAFLTMGETFFLRYGKRGTIMDKETFEIKGTPIWFFSVANRIKLDELSQ